MSTTIEVHVTKEDIANGRRGNCFDCMMALAFQRLHPEARCVAVGTHDCRVVHKDYTASVYDLPNEATVAITDFDNGKTVVPFSFTATKRS